MTDHTHAATTEVLVQIRVNLTAQCLALKGVVDTVQGIVQPAQILELQEIVDEVHYIIGQVKGVEAVMRDDGEPR